MEYLITIGIILIYSSVLTIVFKKRIEQTIPISIVSMSLIVYVTGIFNNLKLGVIIIGIMAILGIAIFLYILCKQKESEKSKEILARIATPGLIVYVALCALFILINKERIFEDYDEFNHWARIVKNMFLYNTYGVNEESIVYFNEYPPFTAIFQYVFLAVKSIYREDIIRTAQCILYLSIIIPITKNIKWGKSLKNLIILIPAVIFVPIIFYKNFYLDILVDGILGVMFASLIFSKYEEEELNYKYLKIFSFMIMLTLTKTSGIALAGLAILIFIINIIKNRKENSEIKKEVRNIASVTLLVVILTGVWYIKTNQAAKRWDFNQYIATENKTVEDQKQIAKSFMSAVVYRNDITYKETTVLVMFLALICLNFYTLKKAKEQNNKEYKYYSIVMLISVPLYMIFLMITYVTIFDMFEAQYLTCFDRYSSTILLANAIFQLLAIFDLNMNANMKKILILFTLIIGLLPIENIEEKYIDGKNYVLVSNINRDIYTKFRLYSNKVKDDSKILFIGGKKAKLEHIRSMNEYVSNKKIDEVIAGDFKKVEALENISKDYDYIFIYRIDAEAKEIVKGLFENQQVKTDVLYKVVNDGENTLLQKVGI